MNPLSRFRINTPKVVHETIDDEVVIIDFDSGSYYSLDNVGADVWNLIESGATKGQIVEATARRYNGTRVDVENAISELMAELQQENLIVPDSVREPDSIEKSNVQVETSLETERLSFKAPILRKYTDMQELLLLDPIHEVDDTGWPSIKSDSSNQDE